MGLIENRMKRFVRLGDEVDLTLIGGKELRGKVVDYLEDGLLVNENGFDRPVVFAGIATYVPTAVVRREIERKEKEIVKKAETEPAAEKPAVTENAAAEAVKAPAAEEKTEEAPAQKAVEAVAVEAKKTEEPEIETVEEADGWITRYDTVASVGAILSGEHEILFGVADVMDQALVDTLSAWMSKPQPVRFSCHKNGNLMTAKMITGRIPEDAEGTPAKNEVKDDDSRYGFGEILYYDKKEGYGKAKDGEKKFIFKRDDVSSDKLWQEIVRAGNTCGIKIAFTVKDGKYKEIREIEAAVTPDQVVTPDFTAPILPASPEEDVNPNAKDVFTDGTVMEDGIRKGRVMFYNVDKFFGRIAEEGSIEKYYFRANDVMQKSLLDYLSKQAVVTNVEVTFSVKTLTTGKTAAGRVRWNGAPKKPEETKKAEEKPAPAKVQPTGEPPRPAAPTAKPLDNVYLVNLMKLWGVNEEELKHRLLVQAQRSTGSLKDEILMELSALAEYTRSGRDEAILSVLQNHAGGGVDRLPGFLSTAGYDAAEMFDTLTSLFAISPNACGRVCGLIAADADAVTLRGEILKRLGSVPENAAGLQAIWMPAVEAEKAKHDYANIPYTAENLEKLDVNHAYANFLKWVEFDPNGERSDEEKIALRNEIHEIVEEIRKKPERMAVEWIIPKLNNLVAVLSDQAPGMRALCAVESDGKRYVCGEIEGNLTNAKVTLMDMELALGEIKERRKFIFPCEEKDCELTVSYSGGSFTKTLSFEDNFSAQEMDTQKTLNALSEASNVVMCGGENIPGFLLETFEADDSIISVPLGQVNSVREVSLRAVQETPKVFGKTFGQSVSLIMGFKNMDYESMTDRQLDENAVEAARFFDDMKTVHEEMRDKTVVYSATIVGSLQDFIARLPLIETDAVKRVLIVKNASLDLGMAKLVERVDATPVSALKCAGYNVSNVAVFEKQE